MEIWKLVPQLPQYEVSNLGQIRSNNRGRVNKILSHYVMKNGYHTCQLGRGNKFLVHRLVLLVFVGECPPNHEVNHLNGIKSDNRLINLEYCTRQQNAMHMTRTLNKNRGEVHNMAKVNESIVKEIRRLATTGLTQTEIGKRFGISRSNTGAIIRRYLWPHVE